MTSKIIVIIDPKHEEQPALLRALEVGGLINISLHVVLFADRTNLQELPIDVPEDHRSGMDENLLRQCHLWLDALIEPYRTNDLDISTEVRPFKKLFEEIIRVASSQDATFVFKPMRHHSLIQRTLFSSTDWNLIRTCPYPLLLVNDARPLRGRNILAAVDVSGKDEDHAELNRILMSQARVVANIFKSDIRVINALPLPIIPMGMMAGEPAAPMLLHGLERDRRNRAIELAAEFGVPADHVAIIEGSAETVVNQHALDLDAGVIILGTVARSGLSGVFVGNTAERVLEESCADIIVVKQADFASPIK